MTKIEALALNCACACCAYDSRPGWRVLMEYERAALNAIGSTLELPEPDTHKALEKHYNAHMSLVNDDFCAETFEVLRTYSNGQIQMQYPINTCKNALHKIISIARAKHGL